MLFSMWKTLVYLLSLFSVVLCLAELMLLSGPCVKSICFTCPCLNSSSNYELLAFFCLWSFHYISCYILFVEPEVSGLQRPNIGCFFLSPSIHSCKEGQRFFFGLFKLLCFVNLFSKPLKRFFMISESDFFSESFSTILMKISLSVSCACLRFFYIL